MNQVDGEISLLECSVCDKITPVFSFVGETDVDTFGWGSLSSLDKNEIILAKMNVSEWAASSAGNWRLYEQAVSDELARDDLQVIRVVRFDVTPSTTGVGFQDFLKNYAAPFPVYLCPHCGAEAAKSPVIRSKDEFQRLGGKLLTVQRRC